jgi:hypothetical protein
VLRLKHRPFLVVGLQKHSIQDYLNVLLVEVVLHAHISLWRPSYHFVEAGMVAQVTWILSIR